MRANIADKSKSARAGNSRRWSGRRSRAPQSVAFISQKLRTALWRARLRARGNRGQHRPVAPSLRSPNRLAVAWI